MDYEVVKTSDVPKKRAGKWKSLLEGLGEDEVVKFHFPTQREAASVRATAFTACWQMRQEGSATCKPHSRITRNGDGYDLFIWAEEL